VPTFGMFYCINNQSKLGMSPSKGAWWLSLVLFLFGGPFLMWIPFAVSSCYMPKVRSLLHCTKSCLLMQCALLSLAPFSAPQEKNRETGCAHCLLPLTLVHTIFNGNTQAGRSATF
jgi:hypothetical protein